jgi:uncharacterized membrane protein (UPF0182 family)
LPELKRVIVSSDEGIVMRETLSQELAYLFELAPGVVAVGDIVGLVEEVVEPTQPEEVTEGGEETAAPPSETTTNIDLTIDELIESANTHFIAAEAAQRSGDWSAYGTELEALKQDLEQLEALTQ